MKHSDQFMNKVAEDLVIEALDIALAPALEAIRQCKIPSLKADLIHRVIDKALELQDPGPDPIWGFDKNGTPIRHSHFED